MDHRLAQLRALMAEQTITALLVGSATNRRYLSGFTGSYGWLLLTADAAIIFTDSRYTIQAAHEAPNFTFCEVNYAERPLPKLLKAMAEELGLQTIACEAAHLTLAEHQQLEKALGSAISLDPKQNLVESLREVKDETELTTLRRAITLTDAALAAVLERITPQTTEREAAWMLEVAMRLGGAEAISFPIIVAAGPNSALPHAQPGDTPLGEGQPIVIDMGARVDGYHADLTRTIALGTPDARFWEIYDIVLAAQRNAIAGLRPGLATHEADALARDVITAAGYGDQFGHGLGHGVGLNIHEAPGLRRAAANAPAVHLRPGMVTSIEPGIYIEGWGGIRIEDLALITADGAEVLSQAPKLR
ncbi:MAG: aminopeptidase P family protein [Candidatus Viridilinea halotolerans]|uniref:Aminopeptidase P family protein n=1 Tax=Candidatus Viridilinea halotolerans TaxID=2491704 RepID=A0A426TV17_9CHLR|nr:MAG: aminopeptidase P family protein [Candidatus Viridilinea halotolerans]